MIIGLCGYAGAGKTTIAAHLVEHHGFLRLPFAGPIKAMASAFGLRADEIAGDMKEQPCAALCGRTPRQFMQWLGTEFGRDMIGKDVWLRAWRRQFDANAVDGFAPIMVVVDDVRFPDEGEFIRSMGGKVFHLIRSSAGSASGSGHASERPDLIGGIPISNDGAVDAVAGRVLGMAGCSQ